MGIMEDRYRIEEGRKGYWWTCTSCGDEGGPCESYEQAWDMTVDHERRYHPKNEH